VGIPAYHVDYTTALTFDYSELEKDGLKGRGEDFYLIKNKTKLP